jgi:hypothetical protein
MLCENLTAISRYWHVLQELSFLGDLDFTIFK